MKKFKPLPLFVAALIFTGGSLLALMSPDDTIGTSYWSRLDKKEKLIFLTGFRLGTGPIVHSAPSTTDKPLTFSRQAFEDVLKRVDSFDADKANKEVTIRGEIEIALMEMRQASPESAAKKLESERTRYG